MFMFKKIAAVVASLAAAGFMVATPAMAAPSHSATAAGVTCGTYYAFFPSGDGSVALYDPNLYNQGPVGLTSGNYTNYCFTDPYSYGGGWGELVQYGTNWCLSEDAGTPNGDIITVQQCSGASWQEWYIGTPNTQGWYAVANLWDQPNYDYMTQGSESGDQFLRPWRNVSSQLWSVVSG